MKNRTITLFVLSLLFVTFSCSNKQDTETQTLSMKEAYKDRFHIGVAMNLNQIQGKDSTGVQVIKDQFSSIVAENCMKSMYMQRNEGEFFFDDADKFVQFGEDNNMQIIGHTLIWHSQAPDWFFVDEKGKDVSKDVLIERMKNHITTIVSRYKGRIHGWDVVNEAVEDNGELRKSKFLEIIGEDYLKLAFEFARAADPDAELYYNDYSMATPSKRDGVVKMIKKMQEQGVKVDGIGMQGHMILEHPSVEDFENSIIAFSELGAKVMITEMDISVLPNPYERISAEVSLDFSYRPEMDPYRDGIPADVEQKLNDRYIEFFKLFNKHQDKMSRVTLWGLSDGDSWRNDWPIVGRIDYTLLFDRQLKPRAAVQEIIDMTKNN